LRSRRNGTGSVSTPRESRKRSGGRIETEHVIIYFSHNELDDPEQVRRLAEDHEYRYWELERFFGVDVVQWRGRKLESYVYPNAKSSTS
jgi:hypothetical protein